MLGRCAHRCLVLNRQWISQSLRHYSQSSYYEVLGVPRDASAKQIQEAFLEKSKQLHPDKKLHDGDHQHESFVKLNEAYTCLSRPEDRKDYDATLLQDPTKVTYGTGVDVNTTSRTVGAKRGLASVSKNIYTRMIISAAIAGVLFGMFYEITQDIWYGREQELFLLFKSTDALDEEEKA